MNWNIDMQQTGTVCVTLASPSSVEATITSASAARHAIVRLRTKSVPPHTAITSPCMAKENIYTNISELYAVQICL